jgi:hypothetical protein
MALLTHIALSQKSLTASRGILPEPEIEEDRYLVPRAKMRENK